MHAYCRESPSARGGDIKAVGTLTADEFIACCGVHLFLPTPSVTFAMTTDAKRDQVVHHIAAEPAPGFHVMDLQAFHGTALLTPPAISFEHACPDDCVFFRI